MNLHSRTCVIPFPPAPVDQVPWGHKGQSSLLPQPMENSSIIPLPLPLFLATKRRIDVYPPTERDRPPPYICLNAIGVPVPKTGKLVSGNLKSFLQRAPYLISLFGKVCLLSTPDVFSLSTVDILGRIFLCCKMLSYASYPWPLTPPLNC